jgi:hypothetical protein
MKYKVENSKMPFQQNKQRHKQRLAKYIQKSRSPMQEICPLPSEIWAPRKHSLLYRYKLGNREASSKTKIL